MWPCKSKVIFSLCVFLLHQTHVHTSSAANRAISSTKLDLLQDIVACRQTHMKVRYTSFTNNIGKRCVTNKCAANGHQSLYVCETHDDFGSEHSLPHVGTNCTHCIFKLFNNSTIFSSLWENIVPVWTDGHKLLCKYANSTASAKEVPFSNQWLRLCYACLLIAQVLVKTTPSKLSGSLAYYTLLYKKEIRVVRGLSWVEEYYENIRP